ncbi:MAG: hypothetical protein H8E16_01810, partial [Flavobacteriales bacterium]|nr:hypothetical protein [Flavobacteriales bacterium]
FLERLVELGKTDIKLWYNINMTLMNEKVIELWRKFDHVKISCSIDDLGDRNHYIRYPTKWNDVEKNFLRLKKENFEMDITQTVSWMNYSTLGDFYNFFTKKHGIYVYHNMVYDPAILSPAVLPKTMRDEIHKEFIKVFDTKKAEDLISMFNTPDNESQWKNAIEYTNKLDEIREQHIGDYLPEFKEMM